MNSSQFAATLINFALPHWQQTSHTQIADIYKWLFQATRGGEHAAPDITVAERWLANEWQTLTEPLEHELLWQPLCPDGEIGRLHLRPFKMCGGKKEDLLNAFMQSIQEFNNDAANFFAVWQELGQRLSNEIAILNNIKYQDWQELDAKMQVLNYPAVHHSQKYREHYHPAYRVLTGSIAQELIDKLS